MTCIRAATSLDTEDIRQVHLRAFSEGENQKVMALATNLLSEATNPGTTVAHVRRSIKTHKLHRHHRDRVYWNTLCRCG
jgi:hypothetical protein